MRLKNLYLFRLLRKPLGLISFAYLLLLLVATFLPGVFNVGDPEAVDFNAILVGPSDGHPLGTDYLGRDLYARLIVGTGAAMQGLAIGLGVATVIAIPFGLWAGLKGGWIDAVVSKTAELFQSIPAIMIILMVMAMTSQSMDAAMVTFGILVSPGIMRVVRSVTLAVKQEPFIDAARISGLGNFQIAFRHVVVRIAGPVLVNMSIVGASALLAQAGLNFLGLGIRPPAPTWGSMLSEASQNLLLQPWNIIPPGFAIGFAILAIVLLGDTLRDTTAETWAKPRSLKKVAQSKTIDQLGEKNEKYVSFDDSVVKVRNLTVTFSAEGGDIHVVQNVNFDIRKNESLGLVGESGCGKTMTGLALLGLLPRGAKATGEILVNGVNILNLSSRERSKLRGKTIAFISQEPMIALDPLFTVGQQLGEAIKAHSGLNKQQIKARVQELLTQVKIIDPETVAKKYPHEISGGMAQRVAIALALSGSPKVLIADEPTTALDVSVQKEILDLLEGIQRETGMSVLLISHDWGVVSELCERAVVMYAGQVVEQAAVEAITFSSKHPYSRGLMKANPHFAKPGQPLLTIPGSVPTPAEWPIGCHFKDRCPIATEACGASPIKMHEINDKHFSRCLRTSEVEGIETKR